MTEATETYELKATAGAAGGDVADRYAELASAFEAFKRTNEQRIAEIDQAGNTVMVGGIDQHVPVVGVIVDDGGAQRRKTRRDGGEALEEAFDEGAVFGIRDMRKAARRAAGGADIPVEIAQCAGMHETFQGGVEAAEHVPQ